MGYVFAGGMILWLGWFGFNPGSTMAVDPEAISRIAVTTALVIRGEHAGRDASMPGGATASRTSR